jgi:hypothetical protein
MYCKHGEGLFGSSSIYIPRFLENVYKVTKMRSEGLFKNAQMQGAQKAEPRGVYDNTLSGDVCSAIPILSGQMSE